MSWSQQLESKSDRLPPHIHQGHCSREQRVWCLKRKEKNFLYKLRKPPNTHNSVLKSAPSPSSISSHVVKYKLSGATLLPADWLGCISYLRI